MTVENDARDGHDPAMVREEIALSWKRSLLSGLQPTHSLDSLAVADVDRRSRLLDAAAPILDRMQNDLEGTGFCVLLADRDARLVDLRFGRSGMQDLMAEDGAVRGRRFSEETTGTNSIATVYETRTPLAVRGEEHYVESMKKFSCYGYPLTHPVTRRLEGVLDITFLAAQDNPLLQPMLRHAADDVQRRLLEGARESEKQLLTAFQEAVAQRRGAPVLALADDVLLANTGAQQLLDTIDHAVLRAVTEGTPVGTVQHRTITVNSGITVRAEWLRVTRTGGVVIHFDTASSTESTSKRTQLGGVTTAEKVRDLKASRTPFLVCGESGTGKSTLVSELADRADTAFFEASEPGSTSAGGWLAGLHAALADPRAELVVIEDIHLLPAPIARRVSEFLHDTDSWFVLTTEPGEHERSSHFRQLALQPATRVDLAPLRERLDLIPGLVRTMAATMGDGLRFTPGALSALARRRWTGNISELRDVVATAIRRRSAGDITEYDIDIDGSHTGSDLRLTRLELAERATIESVLSQCGGNKSEAAVELGISRTTLYKRMRAFGMPG